MNIVAPISQYYIHLPKLHKVQKCPCHHMNICGKFTSPVSITIVTQSKENEKCGSKAGSYT